MDLSLIWKAALIIVFGTLLLRIGGKKSISEMTIAQTVLMISIGTLLIQPVTSKNIWVTFIVAAVLVAVLLVMEILQVKSDRSESIITGEPTILVKNGIIQDQALQKVRITVDQLETRLRQHNVTNITDLEWASLEPSGKIGFALKEHAKPATKGDVQKLLSAIQPTQTIPPSPASDTIFTEIETEHSGEQNPAPSADDSQQTH